MIVATSWTSATRKQKNTVGSDNPTTLGSDYPGKADGLSDELKTWSDFASCYSSESLFPMAEFILQGRMIRRSQKSPSD